MNRFILTGAPGAGKTTLLTRLAQDGLATVPEAATDIIAESQAAGTDRPWEEPGFIESIVARQRERRLAAADVRGPQLHDRSAICSLALCRHLGLPPPPILLGELAEIANTAWFDRRVLFVANLGFIEPTPARRISFDHALQFEGTHEETYRELGYALVVIPAGPVESRLAQIRDVMRDT